MRPRLLELLRCPSCLRSLTARAFVQAPGADDLVEGVLSCGCGMSYPVVGSIPRMLPDGYDLFPEFAARYASQIGDARATGRTMPSRRPEVADRTRESFGYQWTTFSEMACDFRENFWNYLHPATPELLRGRLGLDAGCGFGRHLYQAASCGAEVVGMDFSRAIDASYENTKQFVNVHLVQGDIYAPPFAPGTFDFVYSVGVLHHLDDPERGVRSLVPLIKPDGSLFVWLYSKRRRLTNFVLECARRVTTRLPHPVVKGLSLVGALVDWLLLVPYRLLKRVPPLAAAVERLTPPRLRLYSRYPFQVLHADWFDRLAAPVRFYYDADEVTEILRTAGLANVQVAPTGLYGWRGLGIRSHV